jgi:hypothetical protein
MGVKVKGLGDALKEISAAPTKVNSAVLSTLCSAGKRLVDIARSTKQYEDRTGNLTASIGYGVFCKGEEVEVGGFGPGDGGQIGETYLRQVASTLRGSTYALIVVAGMEYATAVERRGYVVLDGALLSADKVLAEELRKLKL